MGNVPTYLPIINLTLHKATPDQLDDGVMELNEMEAGELGRLLVFKSRALADSPLERGKRAEKIAVIGKRSGCHTAMIGGAPWFMRDLEAALIAQGIEPVYSFSIRDKSETITKDGSCLLYTSPSPRDRQKSRMPSSA